MSRDVRAIHARLADKVGLNRDTGSPDYREEWYWEQCGGCRHWCALLGPLGADWGVCTNPESQFDSLLRFEHDGCEHFQAAEDNGAPFG